MVKAFACRVALFVLKVVTHSPYDAGSFLQSCGVPPPALWVMAGAMVGVAVLVISLF